MGLLKKVVMSEMAYAKIGAFGEAGAGKTFTAVMIAIGIIKLLKERGLPCKNVIAMVDTETGSDWIKPIVEAAGIEFLVAKTRAFTSLLDLVPEMTEAADVAIIDSITHFWIEFQGAYKKKKLERAKARGWKAYTDLTFQDWGILKEEWAKFTDGFLMSELHVIMCGRAGAEYEYFENDEGKMELYQTGTKMKAEKEMGYEPALLIEMERIRNPEAVDAFSTAKTKSAKQKAAKDMAASKTWVRRCYVLKDRADKIDGKQFDNPTFNDFLPHFEAINLGGKHVAIDDPNESSEELFGELGDSGEHPDKRRKKILLEEIQGEIVRHWPGSDKWDKACKAEAISLVFDTRSWKKVEGYEITRLQLGWEKLESIGKHLANFKREDDHTPETYIKGLWAVITSVKDMMYEGPGQELGAETPGERAEAEEEAPLHGAEPAADDVAPDPPKAEAPPEASRERAEAEEKPSTKEDADNPKAEAPPPEEPKEKEEEKPAEDNPPTEGQLKKVDEYTKEFGLSEQDWHDAAMHVAGAESYLHCSSRELGRVIKYIVKAHSEK